MFSFRSLSNEDAGDIRPQRESESHPKPDTLAVRGFSAIGPSRHFACAQQSGRFQREADINRQAEPAGLVANDPQATLSSFNLTTSKSLVGMAAMPVRSHRHSGRIAYEIHPTLDRHEADNGAVLRRKRFNVFSAVPVRFSECVLCALGREQDARLGKRHPAALVRWQCRQGADKRGLGRSVKLHGIQRSGSVCPK
jgi:hypothetical protein